MAETIANISSIFDLIETVLRYANNVIRAPEESETLERELKHLQSVLGILKETIEREGKCPTMTKKTMDLLSCSVVELERLFHRTREIIGTDTEENTQRSSQDASNGKVTSIRTVARSFIWPLIKEEIASKLAAIERCKSNINTALNCNRNISLVLSGSGINPPITFL